MCKTCADCNHTCLGYGEPTSHVRSKSDSASQRPTLSSLSDANEGTSPRDSHAIESNSPDSPKAAIAAPDFPSSPNITREWNPKEVSPRTNKEWEHPDGTSPASSTFPQIHIQWQIWGILDSETYRALFDQVALRLVPVIVPTFLTLGISGLLLSYLVTNRWFDCSGILFCEG